MRMVAVDRKQPPVVLRGTFAAGRLVPVEPEREEFELPAAVVLRLVVHEEAEPPPVAVGREDRPEDVIRLPLAGVERTNCVIVLGGPLLVERPDLEGGGKKKVSEHSC